MKNYVYKGKGAIYWDESDIKGDNPLELAIKSAQKYPKYFNPWIEELKKVDLTAFEKILKKVPSERMSETAKQFCLEMLKITYARLILL